jgi:hypothetical protein
MRKTLRTMLGGLCLAILAAPALALVVHGESEEFGPAREQDRKSANKRRALGYLPDRVYLFQSHWSGFGHNRDEGVAAYQGDAEAANRALVELAQLPADTVKEIHLWPAPGVSRSLKGKVTQPCDFEVRWSNVEAWSIEKNNGVSSHHRTTMTIYIDRAAPPRPLDPRAAQWVKDLDSERFTVRQTAFDGLELQRDAALPLLQKALDAKEFTLEARRRIEQLMKRLEPIHAARLQFPRGIPVFGLDDLMRREAENWRSGDLGRSWGAASQIRALAEFSEESFPLLVQMLHDGREQVRDLAVSAFQQLGSRAAAAAPELKAAAPKMKPESRPALDKALAAVTAEPLVEDSWRQNRVRRAQIGQFLRGLKK